MAAGRRSTSNKAKASTASATTSRKSPRKSATKAKAKQQSEDDSEEHVTSSYFANDDEAASEEEEEEASDAGKKRRKSTKASTNGKKKSSPNKRRKVDDDEEYSDAEGASDRKIYDSDALDEDSDSDTAAKQKRKGRASASSSKASPKKAASPRKRKAKKDDEEDFDDLELADGQEIVGVVVQAPTKGRVPPGQISQNTIDFLTELKKPECNDRQWYAPEPVYRLAEKEWKDFIEHFTDVLVDVDPQIPHLPPKDVIHRIYRDIRFSNDKTPYKAGFSASFSRSGRKGIFAHFKPGNESLIAAGSWCPGKNELATIRANILRNPSRLRSAISADEFVKYFGKPNPHPKGERQNIFGGEDELKTAPKGVAKDHKDIDLLKCRSFAVIHRFTDSEVLDPDFKHTLAKVAKVMQPFVHTLNDMMTITGGTNTTADNGDEEDEDEEREASDDAE
ncbi:hypothetical protein CVT26_003755 [Gymnopilus dilepis]|uniref:TIGR02453 family protein n=1 Tax=Gymnopilus dilepis TaxID=231916 RepID=A0A409VS83_9AGAR|nr:hypothetical protein CVT26_003755 [Gymnopilus dilepis]